MVGKSTAAQRILYMWMPPFNRRTAISDPKHVVSQLTFATLAEWQHVRAHHKWRQ